MYKGSEDRVTQRSKFSPLFQIIKFFTLLFPSNDLISDTNLENPYEKFPVCLE